MRAAREERTPYWIVVGDKEIAAQAYVLEHRSGAKTEPMSLEAIEAYLSREISTKQIR